LQAMPSDFSWLPQMGEVALAIVGIIAIALIFIKRGLPKIIEYKKEIDMAKIHSQNNACVSLQEKHGIRLENIEKLLYENIENNNHKFNKLDTSIKELSNIVSDHEGLFGPVSQGTLENMLFNETMPIFRRLKAFLRLLALDVNGRIKKRGFALILESEKNKEIWLDVIETMPKLNLKIINKEHFEAVLDEINHKIYDGMMR